MAEVGEWWNLGRIWIESSHDSCHMEKSEKFTQEKQMPLHSFSTKLQNTRRSHFVSLQYIKSNFYQEERKGTLVSMWLTLFVLGFNISGLPFSFVCRRRHARAQGVATLLNRDSIFSHLGKHSKQTTAETHTTACTSAISFQKAFMFLQVVMVIKG